MRVDPLQRLHTLENLARLLQHPPPGVPRTLRDDRLEVPVPYLQSIDLEVHSDNHRMQGWTYHLHLLLPDLQSKPPVSW